MVGLKTIRRFGAFTLGAYILLKIGSCCYTSYNKMEEKGAVNATQYALSEVGTHLKQNGKRLQEIGESLEKLRPEEEPNLEKKVANLEYGPQPITQEQTEEKPYGPQPIEQVQEQTKPQVNQKKGLLRTAIDYYWGG